jgi:hypothetical protein
VGRVLFLVEGVQARGGVVHLCIAATSQSDQTPNLIIITIIVRSRTKDGVVALLVDHSVDAQDVQAAEDLAALICFGAVELREQ